MNTFMFKLDIYFISQLAFAVGQLQTASMRNLYQ